jgi:hypothetical protein
MNTYDIREMVAKAQLESAITNLIDITDQGDYFQLALDLSGRYKTYRKNTIAGILSYDQQRQEMAIISNSILDLVNEFEHIQIRILNDNVGQLKSEIEKSGNPEAKELVTDLGEIQKNLNEAGSTGKKIEIKPQVSEKLKSLHEKLDNPDSKESKILKNIKEGFKIAGQIFSIARIVFF